MDFNLPLVILLEPLILRISLRPSIPPTSNQDPTPIPTMLSLSPTQDDLSGTNEPSEIPSSIPSHPMVPNSPRNPPILSPQLENTPTPSQPTAIPMNFPPIGNEIV